MLLTILALSTLLDRATESAEIFWSQMSAIQCTEHIEQSRMTSKGKVTSRHSSVFDYVVTLKANGNGVVVDESRIPERNAQDTESMLLTSGFPALLLVFHPEFRDRFEFEIDEAGKRIAFHSKAGTRSVSAIRVAGRVYPIRWQGVADIDPETGTIQRIEASSETMSDIGIKELHANVEYGPVRFTGQTSAYWLPSRATISLRTPRQMWNNVHAFDAYKMFSVSSSAKNPSVN